MVSPSLPEWIQSILHSKQYRDLDIPMETIHHLLVHPELEKLNQRALTKWLKRKLHNIVAAYLGDPDYISALRQMDSAFSTGDEVAQKDFCRKILGSHSSTRERMEYLESFYKGIFGITGNPRSISDLACGLNPFAFPWMGLDSSVQYHAYDIHKPRIELINHFFTHLHLAPLAEQRDILANPPSVSTDVTFLFKEAHRLDQRQKGCNKTLWPKINSRWLIVSLPSQSLSGKHDLIEKHRTLIRDSIGNFPWIITELEFGNEMVFCINKFPANVESSQ